MRRVQISVICTRFARYLYSRKQSWIINHLTVKNFIFFSIKKRAVTVWPVMQTEISPYIVTRVMLLGFCDGGCYSNDP